MALVEGCRHALEISVPADAVEAASGQVMADVQKKARLPGFRPGKAPASLIRKQFAGEIRQQVLEKLIPEYLQKQIEAENLSVVGRPDVSDIHFHEGEPLRFKAEFDVVPQIELGEYTDIEVPYHDPEVTEEDIDKRLGEIRDQKAQFVNIDPRPLKDGDFAVLHLHSIAGIEGKPIHQDEMVLQLGGEDTLPGFTENLRGLSPGDEKEFEVSYPEDYLSDRLAGKTIRFHARIDGLRRKELPELNDEFAQDLGDYRDIGEVREAIRKAIFGQRQVEAQRDAKNKIVEKLVEAHDFPVPETFVDRQIENRVESRVRAMADQGVDVKNLKLDWEKVKSANRDPAVGEVKASMLLSRIAEREAIHATRDEVDREVEKIARQTREPIAAVQMRFEKDGTLGRIANHIQTEKTLNFLFERARKTA